MRLRVRFFLAAAAGLLLLGLLALPVLLRPRDQVRRVLVEAGPSWANLDRAQQDGLLLLVEDLLQEGGATTLEGLPAGSPLPPGALRLRVDAERDGARLRIRARWELGQGGGSLDTSMDPTPQAGLLRLTRELGFADSRAAALLPSDPLDLPLLLEGLGATVVGGDRAVEFFLPSADLLRINESGCAAATFVRAQAQYRRLLTASPGDLQAQMRCAETFREALAQLPDYPRAAHYSARFLTDVGDQRGALELLFKALRAHPQEAQLQAAVAYAARTAGLLEGSRRALARRDALLGFPGEIRGLAENTYLYSGDWGRFDLSLGLGSEERVDPVGDFYRGYLRLLRGDKGAALPFLQRASRSQGESSQFEALATAYRLGLEGRGPEASKLLQGLEQTRVQVRVPDGEYTFKLAEAHAFLGQPAEAMQMASRAFSQGFGCTEWYLKSPLLEPLREQPRWKALVQHLEERQRLLEQRFPAEDFGN